MIIHPHIDPTPDRPIVQFREPKEQVNLEKELPFILHGQGWGCGTHFHVQFLSHDRTKLLADGEFVVISEMESLQTTDNAYTPMTKAVVSRKVEQIGDWVYFNGKEEKIQENPVKTATIKWNPGKKVHQIVVDDEVVYESSNKAEAEKEMINWQTTT